jgi:hypothetical protein
MRYYRQRDCVTRFDPRDSPASGHTPDGDFCKILQRATAKTPNDAIDLRQLFAGQEFDCRQTPCSAGLAVRNQRARREPGILADELVLENPMMTRKQALSISQ